jgi:hypothetical protein
MIGVKCRLEYSIVSVCVVTVLLGHGAITVVDWATVSTLIKAVLYQWWEDSLIGVRSQPMKFIVSG